MTSEQHQLKGAVYPELSNPKSDKRVPVGFLNALWAAKVLVIER